MPLHVVEAIVHVAGALGDALGMIKAIFSAQERQRLRQLGAGQLPAALFIGFAALIVIGIAAVMLVLVVLRAS